MTRSVIACVLACSLVGCESMGTSASTLEVSDIGGYASRSSLDAEIGQATLLSSNESRGPAANAVAAPAADAPPATTQAAPRLVIYSATLRIVVPSTAEAMSSVLATAKAAGGYLQESDKGSITVRVPANTFDAAIGKLERLGEVVERAVKASDVGEQMFDLDVRLDNARKTRDRLADHLAKSEKMEDTIKLEAELSRVTTEIEQLEGKRRSLASQVAMSTIRVELNGSRPQTAVGEPAASPFPWVARLGDGLVAGAAEAMPRQPRFLDRGPKFDPPAGFVRYYSSKELVEAIDADGVRIKVQRHENFDRAPIDFWMKLARKTLVETRALVAGEWERTNVPPAELDGTRESGGRAMAYRLYLLSDNDHVWTFEAWGPTERFQGPLGNAIDSSARSLKR